MPKGNITESVQVLRDAAAAFGAWRDRLPEPECEASVENWIAGCERTLASEAPRRNPGRHEFRWPSQSRSGKSASLTWSFDVIYEVEERRGRVLRDLRVRWTIGRAVGNTVPLVVEGTCLSFADELAESLADDLEADEVTGTLRLRSSGLPFGTFVHGTPRAARERVANLVRPLIVVGSATSEEEIVAQLAIFALRTRHLLDERAAAFAALERWLARLVAARDPDIISEAAGIVFRKWIRPTSARSFRDYCRRTVRGLVKDAARHDADQHGASADGDVRTVDDLARRTGVPRRTLYRWLRDDRIERSVTRWTSTAATAGGLTMRRTHRRYDVDRATADAASNMLRVRTLRRDLVVHLARRRGTTLRAARALVQRRLDRGATLEDAARELLAN